MKSTTIKNIGLLMLLLGLLSSCATLKEYEKTYINDPDMALTERKIKKFDTTFQAYREGASGATGGSSGGGCGCN